MRIFELQNFSFTYPKQNSPAISEISLSINEGDFAVICGASGSGKTTLLKQLKPAVTPSGAMSGVILFKNAILSELSFKEQSSAIGFVSQSPEAQIVTDKVWHELAFGPESLGWENSVIRRRVAETAAFFGIQGWFHKDVAELSGGQKQLLNLAAVMVMQPDVLVLDEPTAQLDPIAASELIGILSKINRELGTTVVMTEHHTEEAFSVANRAIILDEGRVICDDTPSGAGEKLRTTGHSMLLSMPAAMQGWMGAAQELGTCPVDVREGRQWFGSYKDKFGICESQSESVTSEADIEAAKSGGASSAIALEMKGILFRYSKNSSEVLKDLDFRAEKGRITALLGGNGSGKTTCLRIMSGLSKPQHGKVKVSGRIGMLPQDPQTLFLRDSVRDNLYDKLFTKNISESGSGKIADAISFCRLEALLDKHPYDLSGGEQQRTALAMVLSADPDILLLDEPTKGLDADFRHQLGLMLRQLSAMGKTIIIVSHDVDFCAEFADSCAMLFDGGIVSSGSPMEFFSGNSFYTTAANRISRGIAVGIVTTAQLISACGGKGSPSPDSGIDGPNPDDGPGHGTGSLTTGGAVGALAGGIDNPTLSGGRSRRMLMAAICFLMLVPATLLIGQFAMSGRRYYFISLLIIIELMIPLFLSYESRKPRARELAMLAVMCAIGVAGRGAFFMLPEFKPVMAITIITGAALGAESGFAAGAIIMLVSNMLFSQGPWTPWQMFSMGLVGLLAGLLFHRRRSVENAPVKVRKTLMCLFGAFGAIVIYGGIMNPASALMWTTDIDFKIILGYYATGFPMDCIQAVATVFFLWVAAEPLLKKLTRVQTKYGRLESAGVA